MDTGTTPKPPPAVMGCQRIEKDHISHENLPIWFVTLYRSSWPSFCLLGIRFHCPTGHSYAHVTEPCTLRDARWPCERPGTQMAHPSSRGELFMKRLKFLEGGRGCPQESSDDLIVITKCSVSSQKDTLQRSSELIGGVSSCPVEDLT